MTNKALTSLPSRFSVSNHDRNGSTMSLSSTHSARIFIVDDDPALSILLTTLFTKNGYQVTTARDFHTAKQQLEREAFDLILLDVNIIYGNGLDLLSYLRQSLQLATPVIVISAVHQEATLIRSLELGADDFVYKPFNPHDLVKQVAAILA
ncbi:MAG TPA: response regulator transcription factor [Phototrophicaceae bacterium]|nr:response regulator transcription factor [Phototrophicaceae bacterium]